MARITPALVAVALIVGYAAGASTGAPGVAAPQQTTPAAPPAWSTIPLAPNPGEVACMLIKVNGGLYPWSLVAGSNQLVCGTRVGAGRQTGYARMRGRE
jgi:hypothetical protein